MLFRVANKPGILEKPKNVELEIYTKKTWKKLEFKKFKKNLEFLTKITNKPGILTSYLNCSLIFFLKSTFKIALRYLFNVIYLTQFLP